MTNNTKLRIEEGSINFWIKEDSINFTDSKPTVIVEITPVGGSILRVKDDDNKLKVFFVVLGKGRIDLEYDVSNEDPNKRHMVAFTWSLEKNELKLYFDGKEVVNKKVSF